MRVSLKWLQDYVDVTVSAEELGRLLTMAGIEVDAIHPVGEAWNHVWTARIDGLSRHPNADRLQLVDAFYGGDRRIQVVTGATNISVGDIVPVGLVGTRYRDSHVTPPAERILQPTMMRGIPSEAMVMSGFELGLNDDHSGILILPRETRVGIPLSEALGDTVIELDLKGRPDGLSMIGVAREVAALTNQRIRFPVGDITPSRGRRSDEPLGVTVDDPTLCPRFVSVLLKDVKIGPSPAWMQERLQAAGIRAINNVVDITNFVMIEWGQPLHAFDYDHVPAGHLVARAAKPGEVLQTLAAEREAVTLNPDMVVVAGHPDHGGHPYSLAGIIGGASTEISDTSTSILLEAANWKQSNVRRTARALLPRPTDASRRFERGVPQDHALPAALRAARLMVDLAGATMVGDAIDAWPGHATRSPIKMPLSECTRLLGITYAPDAVASVFTRLGFSFSMHGDGSDTVFNVEAPVWRLDIEQAADLVEEVARIDGYEKVPSTIMEGALPQLPQAPSIFWEDAVRDVLAGSGHAEIVPYTWTSVARLSRVPHASSADLAQLVDARVHPNVSPVRISNPASADQEVMRTSSLQSMLDAVRAGLKHEDRDVHLFDVGRIFVPRPDDLPEERRIVTIGMGAHRSGDTIGERHENSFYDLKATVEAILGRLGASGHGYIALAHPAFHPYRTAAIVLDHRPEAAGRKPVRPEDVIGVIGEVDRAVASNNGISERVLLASLDLDRLIAKARDVVPVSPLPRFQAVIEDLAFILPDAIPAERLTSSILRTGAPLLERVDMFDVYTGDRVPTGTRSLAYTLTFRAPDHTLAGDEVAPLRAKIVAQAERQVGAKLRGPDA